jgi:hypothetical protein
MSMDIHRAVMAIATTPCCTSGRFTTHQDHSFKVGSHAVGDEVEGWDEGAGVVGDALDTQAVGRKVFVGWLEGIPVGILDVGILVGASTILVSPTAEWVVRVELRAKSESGDSNKVSLFDFAITNNV